MSSSINSPDSLFSVNNSPRWTSVGTARSYFVGELEDDSVKKQIDTPPLSKPLKMLREHFAKIHIGSELFFQSLDFLNWIGCGSSKKRNIVDERFYVLLSGLVLMRKANILGGICIPWELLKNQISDALLSSGFSKKEINSDCWCNWLLSSFKKLKSSEIGESEGGIFVENDSLIYFGKNWLIESQLSSLIIKRIKMNLEVPKIKLSKNTLTNVLEKNPMRFRGEDIKLSEEQKKAVFLAISSPFLIITGGPGTGKTSLAVILLRVLKRLGIAKNPALTAPTGRATKRMHESVMNSILSIKNLEKLKDDVDLLEVAAEAKTLHRLLKYNHLTGNFSHHEYNPLEHDLLIVDEGSMIDQEMMISLFKAANSNLPYHPPVSRIILLGDANQLPSIGSGAVFSALTSNPDNFDGKKCLTRKSVQIVTLKRSYRQDIEDSAGRNILGVAETIKEMEADQFQELFYEIKSQNNREVINKVNSLKEIDLEKVSFLNQPNSIDNLRNFTKWWFENFFLDEKFFIETQKVFPHDATKSCENVIEYLLSHLEKCKILTVTQVYNTGARAINQMFREFWIDENNTKNFFHVHYPGEPVMVTENNYMLGLFNGDMGIFLKFKNPNDGRLEMKAVFKIDGNFKAFYDYELFQLQTAYAITVHKSQGSEYNNLALILPNFSSERGKFESEIQSFQQIMSREMLYTALTRAKKSVLILGEQRVLEYLSLNKVLRFSGLRTWI